MEAAWTLPACPLRQRRQGSGRAAARSLPPLPQRASVGVFHAFPFHGTPHRWTVGRAVSHGCVRLFEENVQEVFELVQVGTPVTVLP